VANPFGRDAFTQGEKSKVVVRKGQSLRLRFGILVWSGESDPGSAYREYLQQAREADHTSVYGNSTYQRKR
jgi:hypothetical protein